MIPFRTHGDQCGAKQPQDGQHKMTAKTDICETCGKTVKRG